MDALKKGYGCQCELKIKAEKEMKRQVAGQMTLYDFMDVNNIDSVDEKQNDAQIRRLVNSLIEENGYPDESLSVSTLGIISAISGGCLYVIIPHLGLKRTFYIDEDKHTFKGETHTMTLTLNFATDIGSAG